MDQCRFPDVCMAGVYTGVGVAVVPAVATTLIACSKAIFVNIILGVAISILTGGNYTATVSGISLVHVPLLWKASLFCACVGGGILALSLAALAAYAIYTCLTAPKKA